VSTSPLPRPRVLPLDEHERICEALHCHYRAELGKVAMQVVVYRAALEDAGLVPPDKDGEELLAMWRDAAAVISTASEFVHRLGTSRELLDSEWRNGPDRWKAPFGRWREEEKKHGA